METTLIVEGMTCGGCEKSVRAAIMQTQGIADAALDRSRDQAVIRFNVDLTNASAQTAALQEVMANVKAAGFDCRLP